MALVLADRVKDTTTTAGTGTITLSGTPPTGYQAFSAIGNGNTTYYTIAGGSEWEVGIGTYTSSGTTLSRDTVLASSAGGTTKVDFAAGTKDVFVTYPAEKAISDGYGTLPVTNGGTGTTTQFTAGSVVFAGTSGVYNQDNANLFWDDSNNRLGIGTTTPTYGLSVDGNVLSQRQYGSVGNFILQRADGTKGSPTAVAAAATVGGPTGQAYDGTDYRTIGAVRFVTNGATSGTNYGGDIIFVTGNPGAATTSTKMRLDGYGNLGLGVTPSAWGSFYKAIESTTASEFAITSQQNGIEFGRGYYKINSGFASIATTTQAASKYAQDGNGIHIWSNAAGTTVGGTISFTERMRLDASGNLGLGVTPSAWSATWKALQIGNGFTASSTSVAAVFGSNFSYDGTNYKYTAAGAANQISSDSNGISFLTAPSGSSGANITFTEGMRLNSNGLGVSVAPVAGIKVYARTALTATAYYADNGANSGFKVDFASGLTSIGQDFNAPLAFLTNNTEKMRLDASGRLGIGVASPTSVLTIGTGTFSAAGAGTSGIYTDATAGLTIISDGFQTATRAGATTMLLDASGNFGIGTATPTSGFRLDVVAATARIRLNSSTGTNLAEHRIINTGGTRYIGNDSSGGSLTGVAYAAYDWYSGNYPMIFAVNNGEKMRLTAAGDFLVGTATAVGTLTVKGRQTLTIGTQSTYAASVGNASGDDYTIGSDASFVYTQSWNSKPFIINSQGNEVRIAGTTDQGAYNLQCNGTGVWGAGAYVNGSDARIKDNIQPLPTALNAVLAIEPVTYQYKPEHSKDQSVQPGFIAQQLLEALEGQSYLEGIVHQGPEHYNVAYQNVIPLLVKAIQELNAKVAALEAA